MLATAPARKVDPTQHTWFGCRDQRTVGVEHVSKGGQLTFGSPWRNPPPRLTGFHQHDGGSEEEEEGDEEEEEMEESEEGEELEEGEEDEGEGAGRPAPTRPTGANRKQRRYKLRKREVTRRQVFNVTAEEPLPRKVRIGSQDEVPPGGVLGKGFYLSPLLCFLRTVPGKSGGCSELPLLRLLLSGRSLLQYLKSR